MDYNKLKDFRNTSKGFTGQLGLRFVEISDGYARAELPIDPALHNNPIGSVHGGVIFSIADSVGGAAAYTKGSYVTTVTGDINYLTAAIGTKTLIAEATEVKAGKNILVYDVNVFNETGTKIAATRMTYYSLHKSIEPDL
ncbi:phenylacetic acid degradation protein PaaD [Clostridia bacterium]|nr:phenylacetic acid degradation protein PaaD [Clostridia bacterium]